MLPFYAKPIKPVTRRNYPAGNARTYKNVPLHRRVPLPGSHPAGRCNRQCSRVIPCNPNATAQSRPCTGRRPRPREIRRKPLAIPLHNLDNITKISPVKNPDTRPSAGGKYDYRTN